MEEEKARKSRRAARTVRRARTVGREEPPAASLGDGLLARMDEEYQSYRQAVRQALAAAEEVIRLELRSLRDEVAEMRARLAALEARLTGGHLVAVAPTAVPVGTGEQARRRIKWGSSPEAVRETVFAQLATMVDDPDQVSTELIKQRIPSMLRWIYGERAVFKGIEGLRQEFRDHWRGRRAAGGAQLTVGTPAPGGHPAEETMVSAGSA